MATLSCPVHGPQAGGPICAVPGCMQPLRRATPPAPPAEAAPPPLCAVPGCSQELDVDGRCPLHSLDAPVRAGYGLRFPWAVVPVDGLVRVGRSDEAGALGDRLDAYDTVSRRHAEVRRDGDRVVVRDLDSANGTFVNGERIPPRTDREVHPGDVLRFSSALQVTVTTGETG